MTPVYERHMVCLRATHDLSTGATYGPRLIFSSLFSLLSPLFSLLFFESASRNSIECAREAAAAAPEEGKRDIALRKTDFGQRAGEAEAVQQTEGERVMF